MSSSGPGWTPLPFGVRICWRGCRCSRSTILPPRRYKRQRLLEMSRENPSATPFRAGGFQSGGSGRGPQALGVDPQAPSFFSWLGVTYYLTRDAVFATWRAIAEVAPAGSAVIFDYLDTDAFVPGKGGQARADYDGRRAAGGRADDHGL